MQEVNQPKRATEGEMVMNAFKYVLTQYGLAKGLKKYGSKGEEAAEKKQSQIHEMNALRPINANSLSDDDEKRP